MSYFAQISNNIVTAVIAAEQDYIDWRKSNFPNEEWVQTSYNTRGGVHYDPITGIPSENQSKALRKNYASIGYFYDSKRDAFVPPKPYASWLFDETTCTWLCSVTFPTTKTYTDSNNVEQAYFIKWDEKNLRWIASKTTGEEDIFVRKNVFTKYWNTQSLTWENLEKNEIDDSI